jgi:hypothetical protein
MVAARDAVVVGTGVAVDGAAVGLDGMDVLVGVEVLAGAVVCVVVSVGVDVCVT